MLKFCANLSFLWTEVDFLARFEKAAQAGFKAVEYMLPYAFTPEQIGERLRQYKLEQILFNLPVGDWDKGERGLACLPDRMGEFQDGIGRGIAYAKALDCKQLNCLAGITPPGVSEDKVD